MTNQIKQKLIEKLEKDGNLFQGLRDAYDANGKFDPKKDLYAELWIDELLLLINEFVELIEKNKNVVAKDVNSLNSE